MKSGFFIDFLKIDKKETQEGALGGGNRFNEVPGALEALRRDGGFTV